MPPRYSYWTILAGGLPTAFRAAERADLLPTFNRIREKHPDAEMKWFARGRLWGSPEESLADLERTRVRRDRDWRPGGEHRDPRQAFKAKHKRDTRRDSARREQTPRRPSSKPAFADARPTGPALNPSAPRTRPTGPASNAGAPRTRPTGPAPKPGTPHTRPTGPASNPGAPRTRPTGPASKPGAPHTRPTGPASKFGAPHTRTTRPSQRRRR